MLDMFAKCGNRKAAYIAVIGRFLLCDPDRILTCDLQNRNLTFYTAELRGLLRVQRYIKKRNPPNFII